MKKIEAILNNGEISLKEVEFSSVNDVDCVKIIYCGICGTDYQKHINAFTTSEWGHEIVGIANSNNSNKEIVAVRTTKPCGECDDCKNDKAKECLCWERININGYSKYAIIPMENQIHLNLNKPMVEDVLIEPLYVAINLVNRVFSDNKKVAIIGNGTIGLLCAFYLNYKYQNEATIFARSDTEARKKFAQQVSAKTLHYNQLKNYLHKFDCIINTAAYETMSEVIKYCKPNSRITFNGISSPNEVSLNMNLWHIKNLNIYPSFPHPQTDFSEAITSIKKNRTLLSNLITHVYDLSKIEEAFEMMKNSKDYIKVVIKCN